MKAENRESFAQRDSVERKEYEKAPSPVTRENREKDRTPQDLLRKILQRNNMMQALDRVEKNKGAPGIDGMTVQELCPWYMEHGEALVKSIWEGTYTPKPVRRKRIPKPDGGERKLGIPTVIDRMVQQAIAQILQPIYEPDFYEGSYGYRPQRNGQQAMEQVKRNAEEGYDYVAEVDLSKYFDTINHDMLLNILRRKIKDKGLIGLIKKILKSGVVDGGLFTKTEEGSPQGGPLSPLLANIYLNEYDQIMADRGLRVSRYADDIIGAAKSKRAAQRHLETSRKILEEGLKLKMNAEKSKVTSVYSKKFKFLGFTLGKNGQGIHIRVHSKSLKKAKEKLKTLTRRNQGKSVRESMKQLKLFMSGWLNYYCIASMKQIIKTWNEWLRRRLRQYIWKQWKKPKTRKTNLRRLGIPEDKAAAWSNTRRGYWRISASPILTCSITNEKLARAGYYDISNAYEQKRRFYLRFCG